MEEDVNRKQVDDLEQETKYHIIRMEEETESKNLYEDTKEELHHLYQEFRIWLAENIDGEELNERFEKLKQDSADLLEKSKEKSVAFMQREDITRAKNKVVGAGEKVVEGIQDGVTMVLGTECIAKAVDTISDTIDTVKQDERVKENVKKLKKGTLKIAESAFNGLKKVLDTDKESD